VLIIWIFRSFSRLYEARYGKQRIFSEFAPVQHLSNTFGGMYQTMNAENGAIVPDNTANLGEKPAALIVS
jgi:hypothetical protein